MVFIDKLEISSPDIEALQRIGDEYSSEGGNKIPTLTVEGLPEGIKELTIIMHDPDAPMPQGFTHWVGHGLHAEEGQLTTDQMRVGPNTMGEEKYVGPFPPPGHGTHHYYFWVYAMKIAVEGAPSREEFLAQYADDIIEQARFVATYSA